MMQKKSPDQRREEAHEIIRCASSFTHFIENYYLKMTVQRRFGKTNDLCLTHEQRKTANVIVDNPNTIVSAPRQYGKSLLGFGYALWHATFNHSSTVVFSTVRDNAPALIEDVYDTYNMCMPHMVPLISRTSRSSIGLDNHSEILFCTHDQSRMLRGRACNVLVLDEYSYARDDSMIRNILPTMVPCSNHKIIITGTDAGQGAFTEIAKHAKEGNGIFKGNFPGIR